MTVGARTVLAVASLAALVVCVGPAQSAFPGENGLIVFASDRGAALDRRARAAAAALSAEGTPVRHLRSVFVPEDEMFLHFFEAPANDIVAEVSRRALFSYERIVETVE